MSWLREKDAEPIPGYRLVEPLGSGGFGEVWKCEAPGGLHKAIKFVYGKLDSLDVDAVRAEQEKHALERIKDLRHPFVCSLERIEVVSGELVIVMELCDKTLHDVFKECQSAGLIGIPRDDLLRYMRDAAEALDYMNLQHKLQHLDVKPRNLFLVSDRVKVADFGLVKHLERLSASGMLGGVTPLYASPETFNGKITETSDQYSLAIVYQEMLTGHRPYTGKNVRQLAQQHLQGDPDLRALPEAERPVVARALNKDPSQRFPNCMAFIGALYKARIPIKVADPRREPALVGQSQRPKTLADTLEDFCFDLPPAGLPDDAVNLGGLPPADESGQQILEVSDMGVTVAQPETGALRPTIFIGVGSYGRKGLLELRCRFVDRFGDLSKIPTFRFLCIDPDPEAVNKSVKGAPEVALSRSEVHHLPLQPVTNYRRRIIDQLTEWLPREKLYGMPRSLQPQGSRALGRLAFVDNHQRLLARLRREIQEVTSNEVIFQSVSQTGLALRDTTPRVYIIASAGGGSSGMLVDLCYAMRRLLAQLRHPDAELNVFLMCSAPTDPASPKNELANVYATLTEINHFNDPTIPFAAEYGVEQQRIVDQGKPATSVYLLPLPHRSPTELEDNVAHLGSYLFHEVTTPLGMHLNTLRLSQNAEAGAFDVFSTPFRCLGTYAVWFPRGLLLRLAARYGCRRIIQRWLESDDATMTSPELMAQIQAVCNQIMTDPELSHESLAARIEEATRDAHLTDLGSTPAEAVADLLSTLEGQALQSMAQEDPGNWARQALGKVRDWVGGVSSVEVQQWRKTRINRALHVAAKKAAVDYAKGLNKQIASVMVHPGARMSAAEKALEILKKFCTAQAAEQKKRLVQVQEKTTLAWNQLDSALAECFSGGGSLLWFAGRSNRRMLHNFMEKLSGFARQRLHEEQLTAIHHFFVALNGQLDDLEREMGFCRQRLRHLQENLSITPAVLDEELAATRPGAELTISHTPLASTEAYWEAIRHSNTARVLLPDNVEDLERAAILLLHRLTTSDWTHIDKELHERVLEPQGGLFGACMKGFDLTRGIAMPLMEETINLLGEYLPIMDVAQILAKEFGFTFDDKNGFNHIPSSPELAESTKPYLKLARPFFANKEQSHLQAFLLAPASQAGASLSKAIADAVPELRQVKVAGQADLMFCCDQGPLSTKEMQTLLRACAQAYDEAGSAPVSSPHSRFDIIDWMPLDP